MAQPQFYFFKFLFEFWECRREEYFRVKRKCFEMEFSIFLIHVIDMSAIPYAECRSDSRWKIIYSCSDAKLTSSSHRMTESSERNWRKVADVMDCMRASIPQFNGLQSLANSMSRTVRECRKIIKYRMFLGTCHNLRLIFNNQSRSGKWATGVNHMRGVWNNKERASKKSWSSTG